MRLIDTCMTWKNNNSPCEFEVGQEFESLEQLKDYVKAYSISKNQNFPCTCQKVQLYKLLHFLVLVVCHMPVL